MTFHNEHLSETFIINIIYGCMHMIDNTFVPCGTYPQHFP